LNLEEFAAKGYDDASTNVIAKEKEKYQMQVAFLREA